MIGLSKSSLEVFQSCPRCFWMDKMAKSPRPRGIFPGLPKGIDRVMKEMVERQVAAGMPVSYLDGSKASPFADRAALKLFQSWRTFQTVVDIGQDRMVKAWGELDDLLVHSDGTVSPWDFKSKGDAPEDAVEYSQKYYQLQADMYQLVLAGQGLKCSGFCYFTYVWPVEIQERNIQFDHWTVRIPADSVRARKVLAQAVDCLEGPCPVSSTECEYCAFVDKRKEVMA